MHLHLHHLRPLQHTDAGSVTHELWSTVFFFLLSRWSCLWEDFLDCHGGVYCFAVDTPFNTGNGRLHRPELFVEELVEI